MVSSRKATFLCYSKQKISVYRVLHKFQNNLFCDGNQDKNSESFLPGRNTDFANHVISIIKIQKWNVEIKCFKCINTHISKYDPFCYFGIYAICMPKELSVSNDYKIHKFDFPLTFYSKIAK